MVIANMGDSYARVKQDEEQEILMEQAKLICTMELIYPKRHVYAKCDPSDDPASAYYCAVFKLRRFVSAI